MAIVKLIFFDTETNGVDPNSASLLSLSAMKLTYDTENKKMEFIDEYDRYYFRKEGEEINEGAIKVNGLTDECIEKRRMESKINYPKYFYDDIDSFLRFCDGATHFIAHNIRFDRKFLPKDLLKYQFDTMLENVMIVSAKWPKLLECADYYKVPLEENELHNSLYDVKIMARVFYRMRNYFLTEKRINDFVVNNISTNV
ncbi:3'-5' exonuclease [Oceanivirga miroungae]|uniref:Exonuclease RNase T and DNA polymerase III n=1 Tax=Oceanivirga miroungae TaxID=1130046 RepID=A0A6I8MDP9_9FUSO|nr:3'-5' exonuclease [Oceanivirga miroungae]VWL85636.1 exonuclease RNase T and DNA polymerase III [Oceanivirga miroungae]